LTGAYAEHCLNRNFYKGITGDNINVMLAAAAFNFKRMMNKWKSSFLTLLRNLIWGCKSLVHTQNILNIKLKMSF